MFQDRFDISDSFQVPAALRSLAGFFSAVSDGRVFLKNVAPGFMCDSLLTLKTSVAQ